MKAKKSKLTPTKIIPKEALYKNKETLEFYRQHQRTKDILERTAIALTRKKVFKTISSSTLDCEINPNAICSATEWCKI